MQVGELEPYGFAVEGDDLFVSGSFGGPGIFGNQVLASRGSSDAFVAQMDGSSGAFIQSWRMGGESSDGSSIMDSITTSGGSVYAVGGFAPDQTDFPTGVLPANGSERADTC